MANRIIDTSQQILNRLDDEITALAGLTSKTQDLILELTSKVDGSVLMLKFLSQRLRDEQDFPVKHNKFSKRKSFESFGFLLFR